MLTPTLYLAENYYKNASYAMQYATGICYIYMLCYAIGTVA